MVGSGFVKTGAVLSWEGVQYCGTPGFKVSCLSRSRCALVRLARALSPRANFARSTEEYAASPSLSLRLSSLSRVRAMLSARASGVFGHCWTFAPDACTHVWVRMCVRVWGGSHTDAGCRCRKQSLMRYTMHFSTRADYTARAYASR